MKKKTEENMWCVINDEDIVGYKNSLHEEDTWSSNFDANYFSFQTRIHVLLPYAIFATLAFLAMCACLLLPETTGQPTQELITPQIQSIGQEFKFWKI
jgi:hypothetical protein